MMAENRCVTPGIDEQRDRWGDKRKVTQSHGNFYRCPQLREQCLLTEVFAALRVRLLTAVAGE